MRADDEEWYLGEPDDDIPFDDSYEFDHALADCHMMRNGLCMKAGSEECDWECPIMADLIRRESKGKP